MYTYLHQLLDYFPVYDVSYEFPRDTDELDEYINNEFDYETTADDREDVCAIVEQLFEEQTRNLPGAVSKEYVLSDRSAFVEVEGDRLVVSTFRHRA